MTEEADRFRKLAGECRNLAKRARDAEAERLLTGMANELDDEADKINAQEGR